MSTGPMIDFTIMPGSSLLILYSNYDIMGSIMLSACPPSGLTWEGNHPMGSLLAAVSEMPRCCWIPHGWAWLPIKMQVREKWNCMKWCCSAGGSHLFLFGILLPTTQHNPQVPQLHNPPFSAHLGNLCCCSAHQHCVRWELADSPNSAASVVSYFLNPARGWAGFYGFIHDWHNNIIFVMSTLSCTPGWAVLKPAVANFTCK